MDYLIRRMTRDDIPAGMQLKALARWNQTEADWRVFLESNPEGCFAAVWEERVVGTTTVIRYGQSLAWIAMVLVHPAHRGRGLATALMRRAVAHAADCPAAKLDATISGRKVYEKLGFVEEATIQRWTTESLASFKGETEDVAIVENTQLPSIIDLDRLVFGGDRALLVKTLYGNAPIVSAALNDCGQMTGCCLGRPGAAFTQLGPIIADSTKDAQRLSRAALRALVGRPVVLDVPAVHTEYMQWLASHGFAPQRQFVRMVLGRNVMPPRMEKQFAVCGPEFG